MPAWLAEALTLPGLGWLMAGAVLAGLVRGFSGFGTAMVYLPIAGQVLDPVAAITTMLIMDMIGPIPALPRAVRDSIPMDLAPMGVGLAVGLPLGLWVLLSVPAEVFRYGVSGFTFILLACLIGGLRYRGELSRLLLLGTGWISGLLAGAVGLGGPPVILLYMTAAVGAARVRATTMLYLFMTDIAMLLLYSVTGVLAFGALGLGLAVTVPYLLAMRVGGWLFRPEAERVYRWVAYAIIAGSAVSGLPIWEG